LRHLLPVSPSRCTSEGQGVEWEKKEKKKKRKKRERKKGKEKCTYTQADQKRSTEAFLSHLDGASPN
jgi:hypothetical protein